MYQSVKYKFLIASELDRRGKQAEIGLVILSENWYRIYKLLIWG